MRFSFVALMMLSVVAFAGPVLAQDAAEKPAAQQAAAEPVINPMGAGLIVPAGEAASPIAPEQGVNIYAKPDVNAEIVGVLQSSGSTIPYQMHVIAAHGKDPNWKPGFFGRIFGSEAPERDYQLPVSEFRLSGVQKGIMVVAVEGSWLQLAQGYLQWTQAVANHARFVPWSELYQQASFESFQLTNARSERADVVPLGEVTFRDETGTEISVKSPARFVVLDNKQGVMKLRITGSTCPENPIPLGGEGKVGFVSLFAANGAPQLLLEPERCASDAMKKPAGA